jgi:hypothetical protein
MRTTGFMRGRSRANTDAENDKLWAEMSEEEWEKERDAKSTPVPRGPLAEIVK